MQKLAGAFTTNMGKIKINSAQDLCLLMGSGTPKFFHEQLDSWFQDAKEISKEMHVNILDLFYWEHRMGSWVLRVS